MTQGDCVVNEFPPQNTVFSGFPFGSLLKAKIRICFSAEKPRGCNMPPACCQEPPFKSLLLNTMPNKKDTPFGVSFLFVKGLRKGYKNISGWIKQKRMIFLKTVSILTIGRFYSLQTINSVIYLNFLCCLIREISPTSQQWTFALRKMLHYLLKHMPDLV